MSDIAEFTNKDDWLEWAAKGDTITDFAKRVGCVPCQRLEPQFKNVADRLNEDYRFAKVYLDEVDPEFFGYILDVLGIRGTPTLVRVIDGLRQEDIAGRTAPLIMKELGNG